LDVAEAGGRKDPAIADQLFKRAGDFDFFQAVRLLEWMAWEAAVAGQSPRRPVGEDHRPADELVHFHVPVTFGFASSSIVGLKRRPAAQDKGPLRPLDMHVAFMGLIGASGELPQHYTSEAISRGQNQDYALREFFDVFQHRAISLFYRAWLKYRYRFQLERRLREADEVREDDDFTVVLRSLVGLATSHLPGRMAIADESAMYFGGHFARRIPSAIALERMLADFFNLPAEIIQFVGRWLTLPVDQRTSMPSSRAPIGCHCRLGVETVVGSRVWDTQTRFRIRLGPMTYTAFIGFLPGGTAIRQLADMVRLYVGLSLEFEVQPVLRRDEVPTAQLGGLGPGKTMLTRNAWLATKRREKDAEDAVFAVGLTGAG
jgi:type VI secretion system protein ImpH